MYKLTITDLNGPQKPSIWASEKLVLMRYKQVIRTGRGCEVIKLPEGTVIKFCRSALHKQGPVNPPKKIVVPKVTKKPWEMPNARHNQSGHLISNR